MKREEAIKWLSWALTSPIVYGEYALAIQVAIEALSAEAVQLKQTDTLIIADALRYLAQDTERHDLDRARADALREQILKYGASMCHSAYAVQGWIPFTRRPMTEEEQRDYPNCTFIFDCVLPGDGEEILVSNGRFVWMDTFCNDIDGCYLDGGDDIDEDMAWMPLPEPYKGGEDE